MKKVLYLFVASCFFLAVACGGGDTAAEGCAADCNKVCCAKAEDAPAEDAATDPNADPNADPDAEDIERSDDDGHSHDGHSH